MALTMEAWRLKMEPWRFCRPVWSQICISMMRSRMTKKCLILQLKKSYFLTKNCYWFNSSLPWRMSKLLNPQKRMSSTSKHEISSLVSLLVSHATSNSCYERTMRQTDVKIVIFTGSNYIINPDQMHFYLLTFQGKLIPMFWGHLTC